MGSSLRRRAATFVAAAVVGGGVVAVPTVMLSPAQPAKAAVDFFLNEADLVFILNQIKIAEQTALRDRQQADLPQTPYTPGSVNDLPLRDPASTPIEAIQAEWFRINGTTINAAQAAMLPWGLRQVDGRNNNLSDATRAEWGASGRPFPRSLDFNWRNAGIDDGVDPACTQGPVAGPVACGNYGPGTPPNFLARPTVRDYHPRLVSNLISDQTSANPAAVAASNSDADLDVDDSFLIPNVSPTLVQAPYNGVFSLFGQYFDHGLDLVQKYSNEFVVIPLLESDPQYAAANTKVMLLNRTKLDASGEAINAVTPWIDQNQTYTSHPAHQVFLRQYAWDANNRPVATGKFLDGGRCGSGALSHVCDIPNWAEVKKSAKDFLGIELDDMNVHDVPMVLTDQFGRFIRSASGYPMVLMSDGKWHSGTPANPLKMVDRATGLRAVGTGHAFLDDIAHGAAPSENADGSLTDYNQAVLDAHFVTGDGRGNENIGLTSIHLVFHAEHNRLVTQVKDIVCASTSAVFRNDWSTTGGNPCAQENPAPWNGERLFQASKFVNEMEYQHLIFDGFARKVQPAIKPFASYNPNIRPDVTAEFAHAVYRYGHSQLNGTIRRQFGGPDDKNADELPLIDAFLNPAKFAQKPGGSIATAAESAGAVFQGMTNQVGNEIDEFVVNTLRNNLLGLVLDLPTLNMARARDAGSQTLNQARATFFAATGDDSLRPYSDWWSFRSVLRHDRSIINFIAAYGKEYVPAGQQPQAGSLQALRSSNINDRDLLTKLRARAEVLATDPAFMLSVIPDTLNDAEPQWFDSGVNGIDLWVGGLAEKPQIQTGGMLGSTFDHVFKSQMEYLQNGDRFYYLLRTAGMNLGVQLELNTWADMVMRNTTAEALPFDAFSYPRQTLLMANGAGMTRTLEQTPMGRLSKLNPVPGEPACDPTRHVVINGTAASDAFEAGCGDDTLRGLASDDYLRGGQGNDNLIGGGGDDMMFDSAGLTIFAGEGGNDYMVGGGPDLDVYDGGPGDDIVIGGLAGAISTGAGGNDFAYGGNAADGLSGDDGDDWLEGGPDADLLTGDAAPAAGLITNAAGRDVLIGGMDDDLMDGGEMMDIAVDWQGIDSFLGGFGFDWFSYSTPTPASDKAADVDLDVLVLPPPNVFPKDVLNEVEGVSGGSKADIIRGDSLISFVPVPPIPGGADDALSADDIDAIAGLRAHVLEGTPADVTGNDRWELGNILMGGAGGDLIEGRAGDDVIHGNANLRVYLSVPGNLANVGTTTLASVTIKNDPVVAGRVLVDSIVDLKPWLDNRSLTVADIVVRRLVEDNPLDQGVDTAQFTNPEGDYAIDVDPATGMVTVVDESAALIIDGADYLRGVERLVFGLAPAQTVLQVPQTRPTNISVAAGQLTANNRAQLVVRWNRVGGVQGYNVFVYTDAAGDTLAGSCFTTTNPAIGQQGTCTVNGLARNTTYWVQVHARNDNGLSLPPLNRTAGATGNPGVDPGWRTPILRRADACLGRSPDAQGASARVPSTCCRSRSSESEASR